MSGARYVIDSSSLIDLARLHPRDVFGTLWDNLEALGAAGRLKAPADVREELEAGSDDLTAWAKGAHGIFVRLDALVLAKVGEVTAQFGPSAPELSLKGTWADPIVIALAIVSSSVVVTEEKPAKPSAKPKMPDVCKHFGIGCVRLLDLARLEGWRF